MPGAQPRALADPAALIEALMAAGWRVIAPVARDGAMVLAEISGPGDLPRGLTDMQEAGRYRLAEGRPGSWFDTVVGPQSWKRWLYPARERLWQARRTPDGFEIAEEAPDWPRTALLGVRACDLAALGILDAVLDGADPAYARRRADALIVAVNCARAAATCFCASQGTGPRARAGFDIALTELAGHGADGFLAEAGSEAGAAILTALNADHAGEAETGAAGAATRAAAATQTRGLPEGLPARLRAAPEHPYWEEVAARCLACANCTLVCPTCFCTDIEDVTDLSGDHAERWRHWDSCFTGDFSFVHGGPVRASKRARYRQWLTHKLSSWHDQFGMSGCVGCGRCIAWCPAAIDLTAEAHALAQEG